MSNETVVVPREPTEAMLDAAHALDAKFDKMGRVSSVADVWSAMLAARPAAPQQPAGDDLRERVETFAREFVTEQSEGEWTDMQIEGDAVKLASAILALIQPAPPALGEVDYGALYDDVTNRFPKVLAALSQPAPEGVVEQALALCQAIMDGYPNPDINHEDFRVRVTKWAEAFIEQHGTAPGGEGA